uniref:Uncharacterized protein n=1 Tax=Spodoptera frugiperda ascovirus 1a TaxID=113370 RepID=Q9DKM5_SFAVA|nr:hypothetical protein [Spodoptera frugiperda ascovirus 1a]
MFRRRAFCNRCTAAIMSVMLRTYDIRPSYGRVQVLRNRIRCSNSYFLPSDRIASRVTRKNKTSRYVLTNLL